MADGHLSRVYSVRHKASCTQSLAFDVIRDDAVFFSLLRCYRTVISDYINVCRCYSRRRSGDYKIVKTRGGRQGIASENSVASDIDIRRGRSGSATSIGETNCRYEYFRFRDSNNNNVYLLEIKTYYKLLRFSKLFLGSDSSCLIIYFNFTSVH